MAYLKRFLKILPAFVLFLAVFSLVQFSGAAFADSFDTCDGLHPQAYDPNNVPSDFRAGKEVNATVTPITASTSVDPNTHQITITPGSVTYSWRSQTVCDVVDTGPPVTTHPYFATIDGGSVTFFPVVNVDNIPASAVTHGANNSVTIDLSQVPDGTCQVSVGYSDIAGSGAGEVLLPGQSQNVSLGNSCNTPPPAPSGNQGNLNKAAGQLNANIKKGDPVDLFSGSYALARVDLSVPGIIQPRIGRTYYSAFANEDGLFGKGSGLMPYNASISVKTDNSGAVTTAAGTTLNFLSGDHTQIPFTDVQGNLTFTAPDRTALADTRILVQTDSQHHMTGAVMSQADGSKQIFDGHGDLIRMEDRYQNAVAIARDTNHRITRLEDPSTGKGIDFVYDGSGHVVQATGLLGQSTTYTYDTQGRLIAITDPSGQSVHFTYDAQNRILTVIDARGTLFAQNTYDAQGQVTQQVLGDGSTVGFAYPDDATRRLTDGNGHATEYRFNAHGMAAGLTTPLGRSYGITYSPALFDTSGGPRTITNTDPLNRQTVTEFNSLNQPVKITDPAGRVTQFTYEPNFHLLSTIKDPLNRVTGFTYDASGNVITATDPAGNQSTFTYNAQGQVLSATDALGNKVQYAYNPNHDLIQITDPLGNQTHFTYDTLSRLTKVTDPKGNAAQYTYDILNRVTDITDALGHSTHLGYDENGNTVNVTDKRGHTATASYDAMNRLVSATNAKGETGSIDYDNAGNVVASTDPKGQTTQFAYDADDRRTDSTYADGTHFHQAYDNASRLTSLSDGQSTLTFGYDILDRLLTAATPQGSLNYTYDTVSRLTGFTSPNTNYAPVQYAYDNLDRVLSVSQNGRAYNYTYDALGRRTSLSRPNGTQSLYVYDKDGRLTTLTHKSPQMTTQNAEKILEQIAYSYDANGNILNIVKSRGKLKNEVLKKNVVFELEQRYGYDPLNRLTNTLSIGMYPYASDFSTDARKQQAAALLEQARSATSPTQRTQLINQAEALGAYIPESASWAFDENGNITQKQIRLPGGGSQTRSMTYDDADRLIQLLKTGGNAANPAGMITFTYDANGNRTNDSTGRSWTWNALDELTQFRTPAGTYSFAYDPLGRRTSLTKNRKTNSYFYNGLDVLDTTQASFLQGPGLDNALEFTNKANGKRFGYLQDHLNSTNFLTNEQGGAAKRTEYTSYGKLDGREDNPTLKNPFTFTGREDDDNGLMYYRARYYDPESETFISDDPLGDGERYVKGNPLGFVDPRGLCSGYEGEPAAYCEGGGAEGPIPGLNVEYNPGEANGSWRGFIEEQPKFQNAPEPITTKPYVRFIETQPESYGKPYGPKGIIDLKPTMDKINAGELQGKPFNNKIDPRLNNQRLLPEQPKGYYTEYKVPHPYEDLPKPGPMRIIKGNGGEVYFSPDHYGPNRVRITP